MSPILSPIVNKLIPIAGQYPDIAEHVVKVVTRAADMAMKSGKPGDLKVWVRAFQMASQEFASEAANLELLEISEMKR